jgi:hypothetical protein
MMQLQTCISLKAGMALDAKLTAPSQCRALIRTACA